MLAVDLGAPDQFGVGPTLGGGDEHRVRVGDGELAHDPFGDVVPFHLVMGGALGEAGHVVDQPGQHGRCLHGQQDCFDPVGVRRAAHVGAFPVHRPAQLGVDLGDVVGEQQPVVFGDAHTSDIDAARGVAGTGQHLAGRCRLQHLDGLVEHEEEAHRFGHLGVGDPGQGDVGAFDVGRRVDDGVQRDHVPKAVLGLLDQADRAVRRRDPHDDEVAMEGGQRVLQPDPELADDHVAGPLLVRLVLRQVLITHAAAVVVDVPHPGFVLDDLRAVVATEEGVLIESVGDDLTSAWAGVQCRTPSRRSDRTPAPSTASSRSRSETGRR